MNYDNEEYYYNEESPGRALSSTERIIYRVLLCLLAIWTCGFSACVIVLGMNILRWLWF